jgi:hypothetical protein
MALYLAVNANDALGICKSREQLIDLSVTDVVMPGIDGVELVRAALKLRPNLAVILMSGYTDRMFDAISIGMPYTFSRNPSALTPLRVSPGPCSAGRSGDPSVDGHPCDRALRFLREGGIVATVLSSHCCLLLLVTPSWWKDAIHASCHRSERQHSTGDSKIQQTD